MRMATLLLLMALLLPAASALAQSGKIAGQVTDGGSGDPLPGVNVVIEGTTQGATTDIDGYYSILNVRPGSYDVRASFIGYTAQVIQQVEVNIDLTAEVNFQLREETVGLDEVVVTAKAPIIQQDIAGAQRNIGSEEIQMGRYQNISSVVGAQVGVNSISAYDDRPGIRGSAYEESLFLVDGISQGDALTSRPYFKVNLDAVEEVKVQTGGFSAEYGDFRSGIVNVVTKEGGDTYSGSINFQYSAPGLRHFGPSIFGHESPVSVPFVDAEAGAFTGYLMNPDGSFKTDAEGERIENEFFDDGWEGWYAVAQDAGAAGAHYAGDDAAEADIQQSANELYARWLWRHRSTDSIEKLKELQQQGLVEFAPGVDPDEQVLVDEGLLPDYRASFTLGGPVPLLPSVKFFMSYDREQTEYAPWSAAHAYQDNAFRGKLTTNLGSATKLALSGFYAQQTGGDGGQGPGIDGFVSNNPYRSVDGSPNKMWYPDCAVPGRQWRQIYGARLTHTFSAKTFATLDLNHSRTDYRMEQRFRNTAPIEGDQYGVQLASLPQGAIGTDAEADARAAAGEFGWENWREWARIKIGDTWYDEAPFGYMPDQFRDVTGEYRMSSCNLRLNDTFARTWEMLGSITSQVNQNNQLKAGFEVQRDHIYQLYEAIDPSVNGGDTDISDAKPWEGAFFALNKFEHKGFVANVGLRADWLYTGTFPSILGGDPADTLAGPYSNLLQRGRMEDFSQLPSERHLHAYLSPRLGISHPISTVAKIYFNYGHQYQWPRAYDLYRVRRERSDTYRVNEFGNPELKPARTIQYEMGYEHNLFNRMNLRLTGYYKDVNNEKGDDPAEFHGLVGVDYEAELNMRFSDIRGLEAFLELRRDVIPFISGWVSANYLVESEGQFGFDEFYQDPTRQPDVVSAEVSNPDVRPIFKASLDFTTPDEFGPGTENFSLLGGINLNLFYTWQRGRQFTWNPEEYPLVEDNARWLPYQRWDMRLTKNLFTQGRFSSVFYVDVSNLFNQRNLTFWEGELWNWNDHKWWKDQDIRYMESLNLTANEQGELVAKDPNKPTYKPGEFEGEGIELPGFSPLQFLEKRDVFFGIKLYF